MENYTETPIPERRDLKPIFKILIGVAAGLLVSGGFFIVPVLGVLSGLFLMAALLTGLVAFGFGDVLAAGCFMLANEITALITMGPVGAALYLLAVNLPYAFIVSNIQRGTPFFKTLTGGLAAQALGLVAAVGFLALVYGTNLGDLAAKLTDELFLSLTPEMRDSLAKLLSTMYGAMGYSFTATETDEILKAYSEITGETVKMGATIFIVLLSAVNALPGVLSACYIRTRRKIEGADYEPVSAWRMPVKVTAGILVFMILGFILSRVNVNGEMVLLTAAAAAIVACDIQFLASCYDRLSMTPMRTGGKITFLIIGFLFAGTLVILYGAMSMLFGSHGLTAEIKKARENKDKE